MMRETQPLPLGRVPAVFSGLVVSLAGALPAAAQPEPKATDGNPAPSYAFTTVRTSTPTPRIAPGMAARLRSTSDGAEVSFVVRGVTRAQLQAAGATVTGEVGPIISGRANAQAIMQIREDGARWDAPQTLRPALDVARTAVGADKTDDGRDFAMAARGEGVILATYDTGLDLTHPDFRTLDGGTRVQAVWDQDGVGNPPPAGFGNECRRAAIENGTCSAIDTAGHGTSALAAAASNGPQYRGIAPDADLLVVRSSTLAALIPALTYAMEFATAAGQPLVFSLPLVAHQGPHDGTSLEAQAIANFPHLVVAAAGNEGRLAIHASADLSSRDVTTVAVRFNPLLTRQDRRATINVWGPVSRNDLQLSVGLMTADAILEVETATIGPGAPGRTDDLIVDGTGIGTVELDASAGPLPTNNRVQVRIGVTLDDWEDPPAGPGYLVVRIRGTGVMHAWVDSPPSEPFPAQFDTEQRFDDQVLGDGAFTISDIATTSAAVAAAAYVTRNEAPRESGEIVRFDVEPDTIATFTSRGPTLNPVVTGPKPDLAAPGQFVVTARSRQSPTDDATLSDLYRVAAGTSIAAAQVAGTAAVLLSVQPDLPVAQLKRTLMETTAAPLTTDERWGAGRLDVSTAVATAVRADGCGCSSISTRPTRGLADALGWIVVGLLVVMRKARVLRLLGARLGRNQA